MQQHGEGSSRTQGLVAAELDDEDDDEDGDEDEEDIEEGSAGRQSDVEMISNHGDQREDMDQIPDAEDTAMDEGPSFEGSNEDITDPGPAKTRLRGTESFIENHPNPMAGSWIRPATREERLRRNHADTGPFNDPELFAAAEILITSGLSSKKRDKFLKLNRFNGCTPWKNNRELMQDVDRYLPHGPKWRVKTIEITGTNGTETVQLWVRDTLEGVRDILYDVQFAKDLQYRPQIEWTCPARRSRRYGETWRSRHMWRLQDVIPDRSATVIPTFFASDETVLTVFIGDVKAHPVYMTIGNVPKHIRRQTSKRAMILVGYLPVTKLECEPNEEKRRYLKRKLFHQCMTELVEPLAEACKTGAEAVCSDGGIRRIYPVFSGAMVDFPEQCKYACIKQPVCPTCEVPAGERGDLTNYPMRNRRKIIDIMKEHESEGSADFDELGLIPVVPFWADLPYVDIATMCPPDLLHQLYKGVFKDHLSKWSAHIVSKKAYDSMYKAMSPHHGLRHFKKGVTKISHWTGREVKEQAKVYLPTIANEESAVVEAGRAIVRFMYLAHSSSLTDEDLAAMDDELEIFHNNKEIFQEKGALGETDPEKQKRQPKDFHGIPKVHAMLHYTHYIRELGTPDGFNTELPERLHIPYAKQGWRASNRKNATKQMAMYIQRIEAFAMHRTYLDHLESPENDMANSDLGDDEEVEDYFGDDEVVDVGPVGRVSLRDGEGLEDEDDEGQDDEPEGVEDPNTAVREGDLEEGAEDEDEGALEQTDVEDNGTWEEETLSLSDSDDSSDGVIEDRPSIFYPNPLLKIAKSATILALADHLIDKHGATQLFSAITSFLTKLGRAPTRADIAQARTLNFKIWHRCRLVHSPPPFKPTEGAKIDVIRAAPAIIDEYQHQRTTAQFDTALILQHPLETGLLRYRACRVRAIFELPPNIHDLFPDKLAYVEYFSDFTGPHQTTRLYKTSHKYINTKRAVAVIPLPSIRMSCHLPPQFGAATADLDLATEKDILGSCKKFFFNEFGSFSSFELLHHWSRTRAMH